MGKVNTAGFKSVQSTSPPHISPTLRSPIRQETKVPQLSSPPNTNVADEAASTGVDVRHGGAATTVTSLNAGHGIGNINKTSSMPHDSPLSRGHTLGSDEDRMQQHELIDLVTKLSDRCEALETDLKQTKKDYGDAFTRLIKKVIPIKVSAQGEAHTQQDQPEDHLRVLSVANVLADAARKRREVVNVQSYTRRKRAISTCSGEISTAEELVSTAGASMPVSTVESESPKKMKQREQIKIIRDEEVALKLQEEFDAAERQRMA
ncbi:hypothetical protein Tco_1566026 [Tanacetum coccineum]